MKHKQAKPQQAKKVRVRSSFATKFLILVLLIGAGLQLWRLSDQVSQAKQQQAQLAQQVAQLKQENTALTEDISQGATVEKMKELARSELDYVDPGEYVFEIIGAP